MKQYARVISKFDSTNQVKVMIQKHSSCGKCGHCSEDDNLVLTLDNTLNAEIGDVISIEMKGSNILGAAIVVYFLPLLALVIGYIGASYLGLSTELSRIGLSGLLFALSFLVVRQFGASKEEDYQAKMQKIVT
ncbi:MAG: SoxR reducing system RseC family protein [Halanaerobacter sp.]